MNPRLVDVLFYLALKILKISLGHSKWQHKFFSLPNSSTPKPQQKEEKFTALNRKWIARQAHYPPSSEPCTTRPQGFLGYQKKVAPILVFPFCTGWYSIDCSLCLHAGLLSRTITLCKVHVWYISGHMNIDDHVWL